MHRSLSKGLLAVLVALLAACYPEYNWREVEVAEGRALALFPARVHTQERQFSWDGDSRAFSMSSATIGKAVYAVGYMLLPDAERHNPAAVQSWKARLIKGLYANYQVPLPDALPDSGQEILIETERAGESVRLVGRVQLIGDALIEVLAAGPREALPLERAREFVTSLKPAG